jgi:hypothetical protein
MKLKNTTLDYLNEVKEFVESNKYSHIGIGKMEYVKSHLEDIRIMLDIDREQYIIKSK